MQGMKHCDCDDCLCGGEADCPDDCTEHETCREPRIEGRTHIEATDALNDLVNGFEHWKDTKLTSGTWNDYDEHFARWVEAGPLAED